MYFPPLATSIAWVSRELELELVAKVVGNALAYPSPETTCQTSSSVASAQALVAAVPEQFMRISSTYRGAEVMNPAFRRPSVIELVQDPCAPKQTYFDDNHFTSKLTRNNYGMF